MARDHRDLRAFQLADQLAEDVYGATRAFPPDERYGLTAQVRRAAVSVALNIVEGAARTSEGNFLRSLDVAMGSLREVGYCLDLAHRPGYLSADDFRRLDGLYDETARVIHGLLKALRSSR